MEEPSPKGWRSFASIRPSRAKLRRSARKIEISSLRHARKFIIGRLDSIKNVRRHALGWLAAVGLLICISGFQLLGYQQSYSVIAPQSGGTYAEGVVGPLEIINPILARTPAEQSASQLLFSSLLGYDTSGHLRGDLAGSWRAENNGKRYVVELRKGLKWHDGKPITADDVVFTTSLIKNQLVRSPLYGSWSQIKVTKLSDRGIAFDLTRVYAAFPHALTFGILPRHILGTIAPERIREAEFNRQPIGSGPFMFSRLQVVNPDEGRSIVYMDANPNYVRGKPKLDRFQLHIFKDTTHLKKAFLAQEINAGTDFSSDEVADIAKERNDAIIFRTTLLDGMYAFLRNDSPLFSDKNVRKAFLLATDRSAIIKSLHGYASPLNGPLTVDQLPSMIIKKQASPDIKKSNELLDAAGWVLKNGKRVKDATPLVVNLVSVRSGDYPKITSELKKQWEVLGATVAVTLVAPDQFQQSVLLRRSYDALVYELELGADPDVFAYWHSSQADPRGLNLANYKSGIASDALSSAQLRLEPSARLPKYDLFVDAWLEDVPAIALFQPQLHYVTSESAETIKVSNSVPSRIGRYRLVEQWTVEKTWRYASP